MATLEDIVKEYEEQEHVRDGRPFANSEGIARTADIDIAGSDTRIQGIDHRTENDPADLERSDRSGARERTADRAGNGIADQISRGDQAEGGKKPRGIKPRISQQELKERAAAQQQQEQATASSSPQQPKKKRGLPLPNLGQMGKNAFPRLARGSKPFSQKEASEKRDQLIETIQAESGYLDEFLHITNKKQVKPEIWAMDMEEAEVVADMLLKRAQKDARAAAVVNSMIDFYENAQVVAIMAPRIWHTYMFYRMNGVGFHE